MREFRHYLMSVACLKCINTILPSPNLVEAHHEVYYAILRHLHSSTETISFIFVNKLVTMHPYSSFVIHQNQQNPSRLNSLCDFLNNPQSDQHVSRLGVLEFTQLNSPPVYRTLDHQSLREVVSEDIVITEECSLYGRIVLVENISRGIVEILGWALRIDPSFFEAHIGNKDCSEESMLKVGDTPQTFVTWHYPRAITLEGLQGHVGSEEYVRQLNVYRKVLLLPLAQDNAFDALIQHHCSLSVIDLRGGGWLGMSTLHCLSTISSTHTS